MRILIIGGRGFIGSHLTRHFRANGHTVFVCDVKPASGDEFYTCVDRFQPDYSSVIRTSQPDACVFAGGNGSVPVSLQHPQLDFQLNCGTLFRLLDSLRTEKPGCKLIHLSSAAVYGSPGVLPVTEEHPVAPLSPYGWHKFYSELMCREHSRLYGMPTCSLRLFSVFGERLTKQLFWDIYQKSKAGKHIGLFGTGEESRDFIYVGDLAIALDKILQHTRFAGEVINVSSGVETTIRDAANSFCRQLGNDYVLEFNGQRKEGDPVNWRADIRLLESFGFEYSVSLEEGLSRYALWLREEELR